MPDETESAFAAWLDSPETMREMDVIRQRLPGLDEHGIIQLALQMEILVSLDIYGDKDASITIDLLKPPEDLPDEADDEPWKDPDSTGWKP